MKDINKNIYLVLALLALSCGRNGSKLELSEDPKQAVEQIESLVPLGSPMATAKRVMEEQQFKCLVSKGDFQDLKGVDYIYCDKRAGGTVNRRWQVALVLAEGKVSGIRVNVGLVGP